VEVIKAKEYLSQAMWLDRIINNKLEQKEVLEALSQRCTVDFSREKVCGGSEATSPMEDATVKIIDLSNEINKDIDTLVDLKKVIMKTINDIGDFRYRLILEMRYINNKDWTEIGNSMGYDTRYTMKLHGRALKEIDEILKEDTKRH